MKVSPLLNVDSYKTQHYRMYPENMVTLFSNFTPRKSRVKGQNDMVSFGLQYYVKEYLIDQWNELFFNRPWVDVESEYVKFMKHFTFQSSIDIHQWKALHELGYLPLEIRALPEGTSCPMRIPILTIHNTHKNFPWLVNFLETSISNTIWFPSTTATTTKMLRCIVNKFALETTGSIAGTEWQLHDFSMRGHTSLESAMLSGSAHLLSSFGTDTLPAVLFLEKYYGADSNKEIIGSSVPASEHSVMTSYGKEDEIKSFDRILDLYPDGIVSLVSDQYDLWQVLTVFLPKLKDKIMARDGKAVFRPDSGNPVDIICGTGIKYKDLSKYYTYTDSPVNNPEYFEDELLNEVREEIPHGECGPEDWENIYWINGKLYKAKIHNISWNRFDKQYYYIDMYEKAKITVEELEIKPEHKGVIELLWDLFGGKVNEFGYKVLDSHCGAIYGDGLNIENIPIILNNLKLKGFASTNIVFGVGSFTYNGALNKDVIITRDTYSTACKSTYCEVIDINGQVITREIFKDPITDDGMKKSAKGLLAVFKNEVGELTLKDQATWNDVYSDNNELKTVFFNGKLVSETTLTAIRERLIAQ